jgi:hypothetical protein
MKKIYLHIGIPKTGSSAIQCFLNENKKFLSLNNFAYPGGLIDYSQVFYTDIGNGGFIIDEIKIGNKEKLRHLIEETVEDNIIISSETLFSLVIKDLELFLEYFNDYDYTIIAYIREFDQYIDSYFNQAIKNHNYDAVLSEPNFSSLLNEANWASPLTKLLNKSGSKNIIIRKYIKPNYENNIIHDFLHTVGIHPDKSLVSKFLLSHKTINPSLKQDTLYFRQLLNTIAYDNNNDKKKYEINKLLAEYSVQNSRFSTSVINKELKQIGIIFHKTKEETLRSIINTKNDLTYTYSAEAEIVNRQPIFFKDLKSIGTFIFDHSIDIFYNIFRSAYCHNDLYAGQLLIALVYRIIEDKRDEIFPLHKQTNLLIINNIIDIITPELIITHKNCQVALQDFSNSSLDFQYTHDFFAVLSENDDPYFHIIPLAKKSKNTLYIIELLIFSPINTIFQIFFSVNDKISEKNSFATNLKVGENFLRFVITNQEFSGTIRIDPSQCIGKFDFRYIMIKSTNFDIFNNESEREFLEFRIS